MTSISFADVFIRMGLALVAGFMFGFERESHGRAAGLRTTMLVCVASAMAMLISEHLFVATAGLGGNWRPDPARLAAGILTGIGFLGAGTIVRHENVIRGVTTAAVLWFVTVLGLTFGCGYIFLGLIGSGVAFVILFIFPYVEHYVQNDWYAVVIIVLPLSGLNDDEVRRKIESLGAKVKRMELDHHFQTNQKTLRCELKFKKGELFKLSQNIVQELGRIPGVLQVKWT